MNTALEYSTRVVNEGGRRCKKSTLNDLVHLTPSKYTFNEPAISILVCTRKGIFADVCTPVLYWSNFSSESMVLDAVLWTLIQYFK
jgi:hypothetical protein